MLRDVESYFGDNLPTEQKVNMSLSGECLTPPGPSNILPSMVTPANINICFSF